MARELSLEVRQEGAEQTEQALAQVEDRLQGVERSAESAGTAIDKEADALKRNADAAKTNTRAQSDLDRAVQSVGTRLGALGTGGIIAGVTAAFAMATKAALDYAGATDQAARSSGISTDAQQRLSFVANKNKMTFDQLAGAMFNLDAKLAQGGDRITKTVQGLGHEVSDLMRLSPDERFRELGTSIANLEDPAERAKAAFELFGGSGRDLLRVFDDLATGAERDAPIMASAWVEATAEISRGVDEILTAGMTYGKNLAMWAVTWPLYTAKIAQGWGEAARAALGFASITPPSVPGAPAGGFSTDMAGGLNLDPFAAGGVGGQSLAYWERTLTQDAKDAIRANTPAKGRVLPFVRDEFLGETDWNKSAVYQASWFNTFAGRGFEHQTFPGQLPGKQNLNFAPYAGTVTPNAPGGGGGLLSGLGGLFKNGYAGGAKNIMGGVMGGISNGLGQLMAGGDKGQAIGSMVGGLAGTFFGPIGTMAGSWLGGKLGGMIGGGKGKKLNDTRDSYIEENFGSVDALREAAEKAGFSVNKMLSTRKIEDFNAEVEKLNAALGDQAADAQRVGEAMNRWGLSVDDMGDKFKQTQINNIFKEALDDIRVLTDAGADFNLIAERMAPELGAMVHEAIEMGGTVPREMEPILKKMIELGLLTDKNGEKFTELSQIPFAADLNKDFTTLISKMDALISRLAGLPDLFGAAADGASGLADATSGITVPGAGDGGEATGMSRGGWVGPGGVHYFGRGGFVPRGSDSVPAMLTPGEMVLARNTVKQLAQGGGGISVQIGSLTVGEGKSRAEQERAIGKAIMARMDRQGYRFGARVA